MTLRGFSLTLLCALMTMVSNLMIRAGVDRAGGFPARISEVPAALLNLAHQPIFDIGFILYGLTALIWFRVVASEPLSSAYPLLVSLTFLLVTLGAVFFFHETLTWQKVVGLAIILLGIFIIGR
jgi:multidrug transporter EmrE-like cation transporter